MLDWALAAHTAGLAVVPVAKDGTKRPAIPWKKYQERPATEDEVRRWFSGPATGLGIVTGAVSGVEMLEFEGRAVDEGVFSKFPKLVDDNGLTDLLNRVLDGYHEVTRPAAST